MKAKRFMKTLTATTGRGRASVGTRRARKPTRPLKGSQAKAKLLLANLGWAADDVRKARGRLLAFEKDWGAPGMEEYDNL